jgi:hypothetical protein
MPDVKRQGDRNYRLDHDDLRDICRTGYAPGTIRDFGLLSTNPLTLDDTCTVEVDGGSYTGVPILYHCRPGHYDAATGVSRGNGALTRGAWAFKYGDQVKVLLRDGAPYMVMGHDDDQGPRRCADIFRARMFCYDRNWHNWLMQASAQRAYRALNSPDTWTPPAGT